MNEENLVENWCFELDLEHECWLNKGEFGNVYSVTDDKVIKITSDYNEFIQTFNLLNKSLDFHPKIYDMRVFPTGELGILMEAVGTDGIEDVFAEIINFADIHGVSILEIDLDDECQDQDYNLSPEATKMLSDICRADFELRSHHHIGSDIHDGNIGINKKGNYVLFDQTLKTDNNEYNEDLFNEIKEKLMASYDIEEDEPTIKENICISKILVNREAMRQTLLDISNGKISKTNGHLECMYNIDGLLQLTDGHHRLCELLLDSKETASVIISFDERSGCLNQAYAKIEIEDAIELTPDNLYGGLEDFADDDTLEDYLVDYKKLKNKVKRKKRCRP
jgi:hypothetical protein